MEHSIWLWAIPLFGDSCGEGVLVDDATVQNTMESIADELNSIGADIVFLQEVDLNQKGRATLIRYNIY